MAFNWLALELSGPDPPRLVRTHKRVNLDQHDFKEEKAWGGDGFRISSGIMGHQADQRLEDAEECKTRQKLPTL